METKDNIISKETYEYYISSTLGYEEIIEKLKGKKLEDEHRTIEDCAVYFVKKLLNRDWGRSIVYSYSKNDLEFINSKYLSDYFKSSIKELLGDTITKEIEELLNSDKTIAQMNESEIKMLHNTISNWYKINGSSKKLNISSIFKTYLYKLNSKEISSFFKNNIDGETLTYDIMITSGLNPRASYYSGRGVMYCDLNENNLAAIFSKLLKIDTKFGLNFVKMVLDMKTLGATEFINSFSSLGINNFEYDSKNLEESNISLDGVYNEGRDMVALCSIFSTMNRSDDASQIRQTEAMKESFMYKIKDKIIKIFGEEEYYNLLNKKITSKNPTDEWDLYRYRRTRRP